MYVLEWKLFFGKAERKRQIKRDFSPTGSLPKCQPSQGWVRLKSGAKNLIRISKVGGKDPPTSAITCCLPGYALVGIWDQELRQDLNPCIPMWMQLSQSIILIVKPDAHLWTWKVKRYCLVSPQNTCIALSKLQFPCL